MSATLTREGWLAALTERVRPRFAALGIPLPEGVRVSCGWPSAGGLGSRRRTLGQCWSAAASKSGHREVFISPTVDDTRRAADILVHELLHAALPDGTGHGPGFARYLSPLGLEGKPTATVGGEGLWQWLDPILAELGEYPHSALDPKVGIKVQGTRMLKLTAPCCGYVVRTTRKWLEQGVPCCPCGTEMELEGQA